MKATCDEKFSKRRFKGISRAAKALNVSRNHLWLVLTGKRKSAALLARYEAFISSRSQSQTDSMSPYPPEVQARLLNALDQAQKGQQSLHTLLDILNARFRDCVKNMAEITKALNEELPPAFQVLPEAFEAEPKKDQAGTPLCCACGARPAVMKITSIVGDKKAERELCQECAALENESILPAPGA